MDTPSSTPDPLCPDCRQPIPAAAPGGLCPVCVLRDAGESAGPASGAAAPSLEAVAAAFPQWEVLGLIGQGGMGSVYQIRQPHLDRFAALKILSPGLGKDPAFAERFHREARVLAKLNHPNIVSVFDVGQAGGFFFLLMEYVDGVNLRQAMRAGRFSPEQALGMVPAICDALQAAHAQGIWHRDIKPENILLDTAGRVKIADFGIARLVGDPAHNFTLTATGAVLGSGPYMAPEQIEQPHGVDHRADIYSLGVVLYEMLTGELPLGRFPTPSSRAAVDARIDEIVLRTLEKERELRQQSAAEVKTDIETAAQTPPRPVKAEAVTTEKPERGSGIGLPNAVVWALGLFLGGLTFGVVGQFMGGGRSLVPALLNVVGAVGLVFGFAIGLRLLALMRTGSGTQSGRGLLLCAFIAWPLLVIAFFLAVFFREEVTPFPAKGAVIFQSGVTFVIVAIASWHLLYFARRKGRPLLEDTTARVILLVFASLLLVIGSGAAKWLDGHWPQIGDLATATVVFPEEKKFDPNEMREKILKAAGELDLAANSDLDWWPNTATMTFRDASDPGTAEARGRRWAEVLLDLLPTAQIVESRIQILNAGYNGMTVPHCRRPLWLGLIMALGGLIAVIAGGRGGWGLVGAAILVHAVLFALPVWPHASVYAHLDPVSGPIPPRGGPSAELADFSTPEKAFESTYDAAIRGGKEAVAPHLSKALRDIVEANQSWERVIEHLSRRTVAKPSTREDMPGHTRIETTFHTTNGQRVMGGYDYMTKETDGWKLDSLHIGLPGLPGMTPATKTAEDTLRLLFEAVEGNSERGALNSFSSELLNGFHEDEAAMKVYLRRLFPATMEGFKARMLPPADDATRAERYLVSGKSHVTGTWFHRIALMRMENERWVLAGLEDPIFRANAILEIIRDEPDPDRLLALPLAEGMTLSRVPDSRKFLLSVEGTDRQAAAEAANAWCDKLNALARERFPLPETEDGLPRLHFQLLEAAIPPEYPILSE